MTFSSYLVRNALPWNSVRFLERVTAIPWATLATKYGGRSSFFFVVFFFLEYSQQKHNLQLFSKEGRRLAMPLAWWPQVYSQVRNVLHCYYEGDHFSSIVISSYVLLAKEKLKLFIYSAYIQPFC